jgi:folate-dependent tRNA-U54 methylase TrmFO/GidA
MNANFGIMAPLATKVKGGQRARNDAYVVRALEQMKQAASELALLHP